MDGEERFRAAWAAQQSERSPKNGQSKPMWSACHGMDFALLTILSREGEHSAKR